MVYTRSVVIVEGTVMQEGKQALKGTLLGTFTGGNKRAKPTEEDASGFGVVQFNINDGIIDIKEQAFLGHDQMTFEMVMNLIDEILISSTEYPYDAGHFPQPWWAEKAFSVWCKERLVIQGANTMVDDFFSLIGTETHLHSQQGPCVSEVLTLPEDFTITNT